MLTKLIKKNLILLILLLALSIRGYHLNNFPTLNPDEAALGYNAYSLIQTGLDEHGASWPLHFKSFGDYKPGGYVYLALPFVKIFGLNPLAVRLPNLILSVLTIFIVYKLVLLLTSNFQLSYLTAFVLAVNPWHIHFSRGAWESSTSLFFIILGIYWLSIFILRQKNKYLLLSVIPFVLSLYIYHSSRIVVPVLVISLFIFNFKSFLSQPKTLILAIFIAVVLALPVTISFLHSGGSARFNGVGLTADQGPINRAEELLNQHGNTFILNRIIHNKRVLYSIAFAQNYVSHFNFNFLFLNGDDVPRSKSPDMGQFYLFELPLLCLGLTYLFKNKNISSYSKKLLIIFTLVSPLASALTFQSPSALRSLPLTITLTIFIAFGIYYLVTLVPQIKKPLLVLLAFSYIFSFVYYLDAYFIHAPKRYPFAWNSGFATVIPYLQSQKSNYQNIYFTDKYDQPYILYLFYTHYDPTKLHPQIKLTPPDKFGFSTVSTIDNIHFGKIDWSTIPSGSLVFAADEALPSTPTKTLPGFKIYIK